MNPLPFAFPTVAEQVAAIRPVDSYDVVPIFSVSLPTGETVTRYTFDGAPYENISVTRGRLSLEVEPDGSIAGIELGGLYFELGEELRSLALEELYTDLAEAELSSDDWANLGALFALDRQLLAQLAQLSPEVEAARAAWYELPLVDMRQISRTIGFGAWFVSAR